ncbi:sulfatase family protein [Paenibacillus aceris]|uniref:Arylsulfatase A-like enzyme n=1 Tax=Paenibacillus aceris TaxID=869555 RepID=A0ABS4HS22_9BACL|nr:sulfatase-like hydrolase/transferase [Paenibacillus aceris]MBP1960819.1 arylsulfatase A-like enzyme [Paenibacillus aceris]NHW35502.1 sulfatase-like hydrolase/transferase [Paenibacillus aceris]
MSIPVRWPLAKQTIRFVNNEGEPKDRGNDQDPWLAWISFSRPHQPYTPSEPFASMYPAESITLPPVSDGEKSAVLEKREGISEYKLRRMVSAYLGLVSQVDDAVGKIISHLEKQGVLENTIVIYASDHGDYAGEHGLFEKKGGISYRAITRVPLIVRLPRGLPQADQGSVFEEMIESVDLFPTLCELAGIEPPNTVQGRSFAGLVAGEESYRHEHQSALTENTYNKSLATNAYRYVANLPGTQEDELYNLEEDPWELKNLINEPAYSEIANRMLRELLDRVVKASKPIISTGGGWHDHAYDLDGRIDLTRSGINPN